METSENLGALSISDLVERFEKDVRYGCHSTITDASRSAAGKELENRSKEDVLPLLHSRWKAMVEQTLDDVEKDVCSGIGMLIQWIEQK